MLPTSAWTSRSSGSRSPALRVLWKCAGVVVGRDERTRQLQSSHSKVRIALQCSPKLDDGLGKLLLLEIALARGEALVGGFVRRCPARGGEYERTNEACEFMGAEEHPSGLQSRGRHPTTFSEARAQQRDSGAEQEHRARFRGQRNPGLGSVACPDPPRLETTAGSEARHGTELRVQVDVLGIGRLCEEGVRNVNDRGQ